MDWLEGLALLAAGSVAGIVNTLAGGGSLLSVPLLVSLGLPGDVANGTNRIGILVQSLAASRGFRAEGVSGLRHAIPILIPISLGSLIGAEWIARLSAARFERVFGIVMIALLIPTLRASTRRGQIRASASRPWSPGLRALIFFAIGIYGGAIQAGVGLILVIALSHAGYDLVRANSIKVVVIAVFTAVAIPTFIREGQIAWLPAAALTLGFALGGHTGARLGVRGGDRVIRPVLALAVLALAGRMLGLY